MSVKRDSTTDGLRFGDIADLKAFVSWARDNGLRSFQGGGVSFVLEPSVERLARLMAGDEPDDLDDLAQPGDGGEVCPCCDYSPCVRYDSAGKGGN